MKILAASIVFAPLLLLGALPASAGQSTLAFESGVPVRLAAGGDSTSDRNSYTQRTADEMQEWQRKLHDFGEKTEAKGKEVGTETRDALNRAWSKTQSAARDLRGSSAEGWESAKASFETASHELAETWHKIHPED